MIQRIPADERHYEDFGWLKTYWLFSFDTYRDPANMAWGLLRVFNRHDVAARNRKPGSSGRKQVR